MPTKILVVLVDRANYGRMKPVMEVLRDDPRFSLEIVCTGAMLLERFGRSIEVVRRDGFEVQYEVYNEVEGSVPVSMVASVGVTTIELGNVFNRARPEFVLLIGDRYQAMAAAIAASYQNICLIHLQGGEVSGSIDEATRHAITKLAHYHFPATDLSARNVIRMGEDPDTVFCLGCPSADVIAAASQTALGSESLRLGVGNPIDFARPFILSLFHPVTTDFQNADDQIGALLASLRDVSLPVVMIWPNIDAGSDRVSKAIRLFRESHQDVMPFHVYKNLEPDVYIPIMKRAHCLVGNSSSFIRDASFMGKPVVLVGDRQNKRERTEAVLQVIPVREAITAAIRQQLDHGDYAPSTLYGAPGVSQQIVDQIAKLTPYTQKTLHGAGRAGPHS